MGWYALLLLNLIVFIIHSSLMSQALGTFFSKCIAASWQLPFARSRKPLFNSTSMLWVCLWTTWCHFETANMIVSEPPLFESINPGRRHRKQEALVLPQQDWDKGYPTLQDCRRILHFGTKKDFFDCLGPLTSLCRLHFDRSNKWWL
jgi:hypothetical protein